MNIWIQAYGRTGSTTLFRALKYVLDNHWGFSEPYLNENNSVTGKIYQDTKKLMNVKNDYDAETINRLAFLREQALIARKLNIANNTLEVENFSTPSGVISNVQTATPYYMRGYSMIEKEIELIETRTNKDAFTENLLDLDWAKADLPIVRKLIKDNHE